jgi:hypothetical protein
MLDRSAISLVCAAAIRPCSFGRAFTAARTRAAEQPSALNDRELAADFAEQT